MINSLELFKVLVGQHDDYVWTIIEILIGWHNGLGGLVSGVLDWAA